MIALDGGTVITLVVGAIVTIAVSVFVPLKMISSHAKAARLATAQQAELRREEKQQDYARQDAVAAKAEEAARQLIESNRAIAAATDSKLVRLEEGQHEIHGLVNTQYSTVLSANLVSLRTSLVLITRIIDQDREAGKGPSQEDLDTLAAVSAEVDRVKREVDARTAQEALMKKTAETASLEAKAAAGPTEVVIVPSEDPLPVQVVPPKAPEGKP